MVHQVWRAVDQDGEVVDVYLQTRRDGAAVKRLFKRLLRSHQSEGAGYAEVQISYTGARFPGAHAAVSNLFNLRRHLVSAEHYRNLRVGAFADWNRVVA